MFERLATSVINVDWFVFVTYMWCVFCDIGIKFISIIQMNFMLQM